MLTIINKSTDPYFNQAFEEYIFNNIKDDRVLIVWRNKPAVIVGCYQNICREVDAYALKKAGIPIVRRMSGGGTVYHDLGNINYTLIHDKEGFIDYDDFLTPVIEALNRLGVKAHKDKTCDIAIGGKKISGSAQKVSSGRVLHHGTLLFESDLSVLDEITTRNKNESFISKAAESAICKVTNKLTSPNSDYFTSFDNKSLLNKLENLSNFKIEVLYSNPAGVKFTIFKYGKMIIIAAYTHGTEKLTYGIEYTKKLPYSLHDTASAITGNYGTAGQLTLVDNTVKVNSTDNSKLLANTFMGQLITFER